MKAFRALTLSVAAATALIAATPALADDVLVQRNVTVRENPVRGAQRVDFVAPGDRLDLLDGGTQRNGYYHVRLADGRDGWVYRSYVRRVPDGVAPPPSPPPPGPGELSIHFIDVGQGDSTLVLCPNGNTMLIDGGSLSGHTPQQLRGYLVPRLAPSGGDIDYLIVSHPDRDHYNLLPTTLDDIRVGFAYYVGESGDYNLAEAFNWITGEPDESVRLTATYFDAQATPNPTIDCGAADVWILAAATPATLYPRHRSNAQSIVVMIKMGDFETVITGDATFDTENAIMGRYPAAWLDVDVLRVGHHGSRATSTQQRWVDTLKPERAIFSAAHRNGYGHPHRDVVRRLAARTGAVQAHRFRDWTGSDPNFEDHDHAAYLEGMYATAMSGTIVVRTDGSGFTLETER